MNKMEITYEADGLRMVSQLFLPDNTASPRPGVLVFPEAFGLGSHALLRAERLAKLGYVALGCDIHGEGRVLASLQEVMSLLGALGPTPKRIGARAIGAFDALRQRPEVDDGRIAAIGFCFGGTMALELARSGADFKALVGFHSGLASAAPASTAGAIKPRVLVCIGADDPGIAAEQRNAFEAEMRAARADWQMHVYGGVVHSFTNPDADKLGRPEFARYDAHADQHSWAAMQQLFEEAFAT